jgi:hypothetical protein
VPTVPLDDAAQPQPTRTTIGFDPGWTAEVSLWELLAEQEKANPRRTPINLDLLECLLAPEVYAAEVDVEHTDAGRGMQPEPTYPPKPPQRVDDWHQDPAIEPILDRYPILEQLLNVEGVEGVYRWARVPVDEANVFGLHSAGLTCKAIGELMNPPRNERTVAALLGNAEDRILNALSYFDPIREEAM